MIDRDLSVSGVVRREEYAIVGNKYPPVTVREPSPCPFNTVLFVSGTRLNF